MPFQVLIVCAGNICRSPMAEALLRTQLQGAPELREIEVGSAGTVALDGNTATPEAIAVMRDRYGADLSAHRARRITRRTRADLILAVDEQVAFELEELGVGGRVELLGDYAGYAGECVADPYLEPRQTYDACADQLDRLMAAAARRLAAEMAGTRQSPKPEADSPKP